MCRRTDSCSVLLMRVLDLARDEGQELSRFARLAFFARARSCEQRNMPLKHPCAIAWLADMPGLEVHGVFARHPREGGDPAALLMRVLGLARAKGQRLSRFARLTFFVRAKKGKQRNTPQPSRPAIKPPGSCPRRAFSDSPSWLSRKTACIHARRPSGSTHPDHRCGWGLGKQGQRREHGQVPKREQLRDCA